MYKSKIKNTTAATTEVKNQQKIENICWIAMKIPDIAIVPKILKNIEANNIPHFKS